MADEKSFHQRYEQYITWRRIYHEAHKQFATTDSALSLQRLEILDQWMREVIDAEKAFTRNDFEKLFRKILTEKQFPHSIKTWLEDEWDDLMNA